jgi:hypothetical protein
MVHMYRAELVCWFLAGLSVLRAQPPATPTGQAGTTVQPLTIRLVAGDGAINSIRLHVGHDPVVRVVGSDGEPLAGVPVTFLLPSTGPSGTFAASGGVSLTAMTDEHGIATGRGLRPNDVPGQFHIRVTASWRGAPAVATMVQTNAEPVAHAGRSKKIAIIVLIAGAAIGGAAAATHGSGSQTPGSTGTSSSSGSIVSGTPTIGPPH